MKYFLLVTLFAALAGNAATVVLSPTNATWRYLDNGSDQGTAWRGAGFNDATWASGAAPMGYGDVGFATTLASGRITYYHRRTFLATNTYPSLIVRLRRDDGGIVWLNGQEIFRSNMPTGAVDRLTLASSSTTGAGETTYFSTNVSPSVLVNENNVLAVEIHQASTNNTDAAFDLELLAETCALPIITNQPQSITAGRTVTLTVGASSAQPLSYQWRKDDVAVSGAIAGSFTISSLQFSNVGHYTVVVSDSCGAITSQVARVTFLSLDIHPGLMLGGRTGDMYRIDFTFDVASPTNWMTLTNITLSTNPYLWPDPTPARLPRRFYRAIPLP